MNTTELNFDEVFARAQAAGIPFARRRFHDEFKKHAKLCPPISYGSRKLKYAVADVDAMIDAMKREAADAGRRAVGLPPLNTAVSALKEITRRKPQRKAKR